MIALLLLIIILSSIIFTLVRYNLYTNYYKEYDFKEKFTINQTYLDGCKSSRLIKVYNFKDSLNSDLNNIFPFVKCTNVFCIKIFSTNISDEKSLNEKLIRVSKCFQNYLDNNRDNSPDNNELWEKEFILNNRCLCICEQNNQANKLREYGYNFYEPILSSDIDSSNEKKHILYQKITYELLDAYKSYSNYDYAFNYEDSKSDLYVCYTEAIANKVCTDECDIKEYFWLALSLMNGLLDKLEYYRNSITNKWLVPDIETFKSKNQHFIRYFFDRDDYKLPKKISILPDEDIIDSTNKVIDDIDIKTFLLTESNENFCECISEIKPGTKFEGSFCKKWNDNDIDKWCYVDKRCPGAEQAGDLWKKNCTTDDISNEERNYKIVAYNTVNLEREASNYCGCINIENQFNENNKCGKWNNFIYDENGQKQERDSNLIVDKNEWCYVDEKCPIKKVSIIDKNNDSNLSFENYKKRYIAECPDAFNDEAIQNLDCECTGESYGDLEEKGMECKQWDDGDEQEWCYVDKNCPGSQLDTDQIHYKQKCPPAFSKRDPKRKKFPIGTRVEYQDPLTNLIYIAVVISRSEDNRFYDLKLATTNDNQSVSCLLRSNTCETNKTQIGTILKLDKIIPNVPARLINRYELSEDDFRKLKKTEGIRVPRLNYKNIKNEYDDIIYGYNYNENIGRPSPDYNGFAVGSSSEPLGYNADLLINLDIPPKEKMLSRQELPLNWKQQRPWQQVIGPNNIKLTTHNPNKVKKQVNTLYTCKSENN